MRCLTYESQAVPIPEDERKQTRQRLQALLAERFQLAIHRETKEMPVYALVVRKNGHKLKESEKGRGLRGNRDGELTADGITMTFFAFHLTRMLGRPVLDRTDLTGHYDFKLEWSPDPGELTGRFGRDEIPKPASPPNLSGPSSFLRSLRDLRVLCEKRSSMRTNTRPRSRSNSD